MTPGFNHPLWKLEAAFEKFRLQQEQLYKDPQKFIEDWRERTFGKGNITDVVPQLTRMLDEIDELRDVTRSMILGITTEGMSEQAFEYASDKVSEEMCDVLITMFNSATSLGTDLLENMRNKMWTNLHREWKSNGDGTGQHTKKAPWEVSGE